MSMVTLILPCSELEIGRKSCAREPRCRGHALLALGLYLDKLPAGAFAAGHHRIAQERSWRAFGRYGLAGVDLEHAAVDGRPGARPRREAAQPGVELAGGSRPIDAAVVAGEDRRQRSLG